MRNYLFSFLAVFFAVCNISAKPIPFDPSHGLVEIDILINGTIKAKFGLDTGADRLYLDKSFAEKNGIDILRAPMQRNIQSVDGSAKAYAATLESFKISEGAVLTNLNATVIEMDKLSTDKNVRLPNGLIGNKILKQFYVSVDYPNHTIELSKEEPDFLRGRKYCEIEYRRYRDFIIVDMVINDDITVPMLFDYCASHTIITPKVAEQLDLPIDNKWVTLKSLKLGEIESQQVQTLIRDLKDLKKSTRRAEYEGIVGSTFLRAYNMTVDYKQKKIYIRR